MVAWLTEVLEVVEATAIDGPLLMVVDSDDDDAVELGHGFSSSSYASDSSLAFSIPLKEGCLSLLSFVRR